MSLQPHQQRVVEELATLNTRIVSLHKFINSETFIQVERAERNRLIRQEAIMVDLAKVLTERVAAFTAAAEQDFPLGKACDLSGGATCESCQ